MVYCLVSSTKVPQAKLDRRKKSNNENCILGYALQVPQSRKEENLIIKVFASGNVIHYIIHTKPKKKITSNIKYT
jgi:uncharacterized membrane protein